MKFSESQANLSVSAMHGYSPSDKISEMYNETDTFACSQNILVYIQKQGGTYVGMITTTKHKVMRGKQCYKPTKAKRPTAKDKCTQILYLCLSWPLLADHSAFGLK